MTVLAILLLLLLGTGVVVGCTVLGICYFNFNEGIHVRVSFSEFKKLYSEYNAHMNLTNYLIRIDYFGAVPQSVYLGFITVFGYLQYLIFLRSSKRNIGREKLNEVLTLLDKEKT